MAFPKPTLTIPDAQIDGQTATGVFVFPADIRYELKTESEDLFQASGTSAVIANAVLDTLESGGLDVGEGIRQELSIDIGGGLHICELDWAGIEENDNRWGNTGEGGTKLDGTAESVHSQMCVLDYYIQRTTLDSRNPALLEIAEYSTEGKYEPLKVVPRNPNAVFDSTESTSIWDGSIAFVETQSLDWKAPQEDR